MNPFTRPELIGFCSLVGVFVTIVALVWAIRHTARAQAPDWIWEEVLDPQRVQLRCRHCGTTACVIHPVQCEGALLVREIFVGQHRLCVPQPVSFV